MKQRYAWPVPGVGADLRRVRPAAAERLLPMNGNSSPTAGWRRPVKWPSAVSAQLSRSIELWQARLAASMRMTLVSATPARWGLKA